MQETAFNVCGNTTTCLQTLLDSLARRSSDLNCFGSNILLANTLTDIAMTQLYRCFSVEKS